MYLFKVSDDILDSRDLLHGKEENRWWRWGRAKKGGPGRA
jgi:hypothetical protein